MIIAHFLKKTRAQLQMPKYNNQVTNKYQISIRQTKKSSTDPYGLIFVSCFLYLGISSLIVVKNDLSKNNLFKKI